MISEILIAELKLVNSGSEQNAWMIYNKTMKYYIKKKKKNICKAFYLFIFLVSATHENLKNREREREPHINETEKKYQSISFHNVTKSKPLNT